MHGADRRGHLRVGQGEQPTDAAAADPFGEIEPQGLHQHHVGEVLGDQGAARLRLQQLLAHALQRPAQRRLVGVLAQVYDPRHSPQQDIGVGAGEGEMTTEDHAVAAAVQDRGAAASLAGKQDVEGDGLKAEVLGQAEGPSAGQQQAVARRQPHRLDDPVHG